jgi:hypothetical protein
MSTKHPLMITAGFALSALGLLTAGCAPSSQARVVAAGDGELTVLESGEEVTQTHEVAPNVQVTLDEKPAQLEDLNSGDEVSLTVEQVGEQTLITAIDATSGGMSDPTSEPADSDLGYPNDVTPLPGMDTLPDASTDAAPENLEPARLADDTLPPNESSDQAVGESATAQGEVFDGTVVSAANDELVIDSGEGAEHTFSVTPETRVSLDGKEAQPKELEEGDIATVRANPDGEILVAEFVDAFTRR